MIQVKLASEQNIDTVVALLRKDVVPNGFALQDLLLWPEATRFHFTEKPFSYLHISGHPSTRGSTVISLGGSPSNAIALLNEVRPASPFVIRETGSEFAPAIKEYFPSVKIFDEMRMDVTRETFKPQHRGLARQLGDSDLPALLRYFGAPPEAAPKFMGWLKGARAFYGVFEGDRLISLGSSYVAIKDVWNLVSISTLEEFRRKGFATEVTSSLVAKALEDTKVVALTVLKDNHAAIRTYEKLGFFRSQDRVWADCGAGSKP